MVIAPISVSVFSLPLTEPVAPLYITVELPSE